MHCPLAYDPMPKELWGAGRGGRVVEGSGLENRQGGNPFVSSNLTHAVAPACYTLPTADAAPIARGASSSSRSATESRDT